MNQGYDPDTHTVTLRDLKMHDKVKDLRSDDGCSIPQYDMKKAMKDAEMTHKLRDIQNEDFSASRATLRALENVLSHIKSNALDWEHPPCKSLCIALHECDKQVNVDWLLKMLEEKGFQVEKIAECVDEEHSQSKQRNNWRHNEGPECYLHIATTWLPLTTGPKVAHHEKE